MQLNEARQFKRLGILPVQGQRLAEGPLGAVEVLHQQPQVAEVPKMAPLPWMLVPEGFQLGQQLQAFLFAVVITEAEQAFEPCLRVRPVLGQQLVQDLPGFRMAGPAVVGAGQGQAVFIGRSGSSLQRRQAGIQQLEPRT